MFFIVNNIFVIVSDKTACKWLSDYIVVLNHIFLQKRANKVWTDKVINMEQVQLVYCWYINPTIVTPDTFDNIILKPIYIAGPR